jgi:hypothetical protein
MPAMIGRSWRSGGGALLRARFHQVRRGAALRPQSRRPPRRHLLLLSRPRAVIGRSPARVPRVCNAAARRRLSLGVRSARSDFPQCRLAALSSRGRFAATPEHSPAGASSAAALDRPSWASSAEVGKNRRLTATMAVPVRMRVGSLVATTFPHATFVQAPRRYSATAGSGTNCTEAKPFPPRACRWAGPRECGVLSSVPRMARS